MKYLLIELRVQDGERQHTHRILHTTTAKNINFAAERYAAQFWGEGERERQPKRNYWWVNGEITIQMDNVIELTYDQHRDMSMLFSGAQPKETRVYVVNTDNFSVDGAYEIEEWKNYEKCGDALPEKAHKFMEFAEQEGTVFTLDGFENAINFEELSCENNWIFITKAY